MNNYSFSGSGRLFLLWIAIDRYASPRWPTLRNAVSGSEALEEVLQENYGLEGERTVRLVNQSAKLAKIEKAVRSFCPGGSMDMGEQDQLIISFAGHGAEDELTKESSFVPYDGDPDSPISWLQLDSLCPLLRVIKAKHILLISDSCFSGGIFRSAGLFGQPETDDFQYAKRAYSKPSRLFISSAGRELTADGGGKPGRSVFLEGLLSGLRGAEQSWILCSNVFQDTRRFVVANSEQTPEYGSLRNAGHGGGELVLFPNKHSNDLASSIDQKTLERRKEPPKTNKPETGDAEVPINFQRGATAYLTGHEVLDLASKASQADDTKLGPIIAPLKAENVGWLGVTLTLGDAVDSDVIAGSGGTKFDLEPGELLNAASLETLSVPEWMEVRLHPCASIVKQGLIVSHGSIVDPGYEGVITFSIFNATRNRIRVERGQRVVVARFHTI